MTVHKRTKNNGIYELDHVICWKLIPSRLNFREAFIYGWRAMVKYLTLKGSITLCVYQYVDYWVRQTQLDKVL
jgi:hypothetical protein